MNNSHRFFHHFIPRSMPCIILPSPVTSSVLPQLKSQEQSNDHILNLSASMNKHCPIITDPPLIKEVSEKSTAPKSTNESPLEDKCEQLRTLSPPSESNSPETNSSNNCVDNVDMNYNKVKTSESISGDRSPSSPVNDDGKSYSSDNGQSEDEHISDIDVDDSMSCTGDDVGENQTILNPKEEIEEKSLKKGKVLAFGIDRILSNDNENSGDESPDSSPGSPHSVSNLSTKLPLSSKLSSKASKEESKYQHHSILSKLRLCASTTPTNTGAQGNENVKRVTSALPFFHHSYGPYQHHHMNPIITSASGGGIHNHSSHQHPLSNCSECLFLRRYCGGGVGRTSSGRTIHIPSSVQSANAGATNNVQFSQALATPCGPTSSLSASFTWMANPSIYDNSPIISPVAGYNQHIPLQPTFGLGGTNYSTFSTVQQCGSGGGSGRRKRSWSRAVFSNLQRKGLEKRFQLQKYITKPDRRQLAATLGLTDAQVKVWFQNRRMKWRHSKEGKVSSGTGETISSVPTSSSPPVTSTTPSKGDGAVKDKKL